VLVNYLGFPFLGCADLPMISAHEMGELTKFWFDRISPQDARALKASRASQPKALALPISRHSSRAPIARTIICSAACTR